jgi:enoyl-CoA hydratase/carnithine racemase
MSQTYQDILYGVQERVATITLNRPAKRNALGLNTVSELCHALERAAEDDDVRVIVLTGAGKIFCAGGDLSQMGAGGESGSVPRRSFVDLNKAFTKLGKPTIASVNGHALAGGLGLVVACDLALAADHAKFGTPEINVGIWPMMIMANIFRNVGRKDGMRLILTGERVDAAEARRIGLINEAIPAADLEQRTLELARTLSQKSPVAMRLGLNAFYDTQDSPFSDALQHLEGQLMAVLSTEDAQEGLMAFMQKRPPEFKGR